MVEHLRIGTVRQLNSNSEMGESHRYRFRFLHQEKEGKISAIFSCLCGIDWLSCGMSWPVNRQLIILSFTRDEDLNRTSTAFNYSDSLIKVNYFLKKISNRR